MVDWEVTATTIYCPDVEEEVTLMVTADGTCRCTGHQKYSRPGKDAAGPTKKRSKKSGQKAGCGEVVCRVVTEYRDRLLNEAK